MKDNMPPSAPFKSPVSSTLAQWISRETTNAAWSLRNPWVVGGGVVLAVVLICGAGCYLLNLPDQIRIALSVISAVVFYGYLAATFVFQLAAKRTASAIATLSIILVTAFGLLL